MLGIQEYLWKCYIWDRRRVYADHAGNMHGMMQESMLEGSTPEVLWTPENSQNDKESETPRRNSTDGSMIDPGGVKADLCSFRIAVNWQDRYRLGFVWCEVTLQQPKLLI
ncbi:hypothetical protein TNCV_3657181 [Trichonephila clavipes]|nr:hypothetical protein TNCV_3657181 [Trichonephila clavipes]